MDEESPDSHPLEFMAKKKGPTCGDLGGRTETGRPCSRPQGWGIQEWMDPGEIPGRCLDHREGDFLHPQEEMFVHAYCGPARFNQTKAAQLAGYDAVSYQSYAQIGSTIAKRPRVARAIRSRMDELAMDAAECTVRLAEMGRGNLSPFQRITADGDVVFDLSTAEAQANLHLIKEVELEWVSTEDAEGDRVLVSRVRRIKLHDPKDAIKSIARVHGLFLDRTELTGKDGGPLEVDVQDLRAKLARRISGIASRIGKGSGSPSTNGSGAQSP